MRLLKLLSTISIIILFFSCSNDDNVNEQFLEKYNKIYMHHQHSNSFSDNKNVFLQYANGKVVRKLENVFPVEVTGHENVPINEMTTEGTIYEDVTYIGNEITIERDIDFQFYELAPNHIRYVLDNEGRIVKKIYFDNAIEFEVVVNDTIDYEYSDEGKLVKTYTNRNSYIFSEADYYFNAQNNLDSIVRSSYYRDLNGVDVIYQGKTVEVFSEYDTSYNPLQDLGIFDELFYRSLSANNYARYDKYYYSHLDELTNHGYRSWDFYYDENGNIRFDLF